MSPPERLSQALLKLVADNPPVPEFRATALQLSAMELSATVAALATPSSGSWQIPTCVNDTGASAAAQPPLSILAEAADSHAIQRQDDWWAIPLADPKERGAGTSFVFAARATDATSADTFERVAEALANALRCFQRNRTQVRRIERLQVILEIANQWNRADQTESLLNDMAEAAVRLMDAERATIFLWDKSTKTLVGAPALGVDNNELRIPDDTGIVGDVIRTRTPHRANRTQSDSPIAQSIDEQTQFTTNSVLCVPLIGRRGKTLGAFEVLNQQSGTFSKTDELELTELALHAAGAIEDSQSLHRRGGKQNVASELVGDSAAIVALRERIQKVAPTDLPVLVLGENGTGKEVISRQIHAGSKRKEELFLAINCASIGTELLESELFGHEAGAFTDATEAKPGKLRAASGGTLFLDEIGELNLTSQAKLLRVLEDKIVTPVGAVEGIAVDIRIIAATNRDLNAMVRDRTFREDLFFRLNVVTLNAPPLRDRVDDIASLANYFVERFSETAQVRPPTFEDSAWQRLREHPWPGNVRELRNVMERVVYLSAGDRITSDELSAMFSERNPVDIEELPLTEATRRFQIEYIGQQIASCAGNMTEAAKRLGLHRSNLYRKMGQLGMTDSELET